MSYQPYKSVSNNYNKYGTHTSTTYTYRCSDGTKMTFTHPTNRSNWSTSRPGQALPSYNYSSKYSSRRYNY